MGNVVAYAIPFFFVILAIEALWAHRRGMKVMSADRCDPDLGNCMRLDAIPLGLQVHNVELQPGRGPGRGRRTERGPTVRPWLRPP